MKLYALIFILFCHKVLAYHHHDSRSYYSSRDNFEDYEYTENRRSGRQITNGFLWDSPSEQFQRNNFDSLRFNGFNINQNDDRSDDSFIFDDDFDTRNYIPQTTQRIPTRNWRKPTTPRVPVSTVAIPGMGTPRTPCEDRCLSTPEYNPACGDDDMTYFNIHRLICAQKCGKRVKLKRMGACSIIPPTG